MMGIEPLSSVMTFQAQPIQQAQQNQEEKIKISEMSKEAPKQTEAAPIDNVTPIIKKSESKEEGQQTEQELRQEQNQQKHNERMKKAVEQMNEKLQNSEAIFGIHDKTNRVTIKIVDKETKEVIKELPPEKTLDMIAKIWEMAGILVDEKR